MKRRTVVIALALVAALSVAVPAMAGTSVTSMVNSAFSTAKKANKRAKSAEKNAKKALKQAKLPGPQGPTGPQGEPGAPGQQGAPGQPGLSGLERVSTQGANDSDSGKYLYLACPGEKKVTGMGYDVVGGKTGNSPNVLSDVVIDEASPDPDLGGAYVDAYETDPVAGNWKLTLYVICANVG